MESPEVSRNEPRVKLIGEIPVDKEMPTYFKAGQYLNPAGIVIGNNGLMAWAIVIEPGTIVQPGTRVQIISAESEPSDPMPTP